MHEKIIQNPDPNDGGQIREQCYWKLKWSFKDFVSFTKFEILFEF